MSVKISIITPSYNGASYLKRCLDSVQIQTGVEWEHVVQDAGSTDDSLDIIRQYPNVHLFCETDKGMSDGINKGASKATGDWWMWLNTDDYLEPGALKHVADFIETNPAADVIYGNWNFVNAVGVITKVSKVFPFDLLMMIHYGCYIASTATFFRREKTIAADEWLSVPFKQVMDQEYFSRLGKKGLRFVHCPRVLANFCIHGENTSIRLTDRTDIDGILERQIQIAEGAAVRRKYGITLSRTNPFLNGIVDAVLWYYYRFKKIFVKLFHGGYAR